MPKIWSEYDPRLAPKTAKTAKRAALILGAVAAAAGNAAGVVASMTPKLWGLPHH